MKTWNTPTLETLDLNQTEYEWIGVYRDGGYVGDGEVSGHLTFDKPTPTPTPTDNPTKPLS